MIFYDNAFRLRISHKCLPDPPAPDFSCRNVRESCRTLLKFFPVPGMIRDCWSAQPQLWSCQGEKRELILSEGHEIKFITSMAIFHKGTKLEGHGRRQFAPSDEASYQMALTKLAKAGLDSRQIVVSGPEFVHIDKGNARRGFMLPVFTVQGPPLSAINRKLKWPSFMASALNAFLVVVSCIWQGSSHEYISGI
ncbi:type I-E CRISPR-associated protein Cas6/Cse3/CasE (plasmid) [Serratia ureilytica]